MNKMRKTNNSWEIKKLCSRVINQSQKNVRQLIEERIDKVGDEKKICKFENEVIKPYQNFKRGWGSNLNERINSNTFKLLNWKNIFT